MNGVAANTKLSIASTWGQDKSYALHPRAFKHNIKTTKHFAKSISIIEVAIREVAKLCEWIVDIISWNVRLQIKVDPLGRMANDT